MQLKDGEIITFTGDLGSGKSTVSKLVAKELNVPRIAVGDTIRALAEKENKTVLDFNNDADKYPEIDLKINSELIKNARTHAPCVVDGRVAWNFLPASLKVKLITGRAVSAARIFNDKARGSEASNMDLETTFNNMVKRRSSEHARYLTNYHVDIDDLRHFDLVIDTQNVTPQQVTELVLDQAEKFFAGEPIHKIWISPRTPYPTEDVSRTLSREEAKEVADSIKNDGFDPSKPVSILRTKEGFLFLDDGHRRTSAAIFAKTPFIPVVITNNLKQQNNVNDFISSECRLKWIYDWEAIHDEKDPKTREVITPFQFLMHPNFCSADLGLSRGIRQMDATSPK